MHHTLAELLSWKDARTTVKAIIAFSLTSVFGCLMGDAIFIMLTANIALLWPLVYALKRNEIDSVFVKINTQIDMVVKKIPLLASLEKKRRDPEESKKQQ